MDTPCYEVFRLEEDKTRPFNCYPSGTVILAGLGGVSRVALVTEVSF